MIRIRRDLKFFAKDEQYAVGANAISFEDAEKEGITVGSIPTKKKQQQ